MAFFATFLVAAHVKLKQNVGNIAERLLASAFVPLTDEEALERGSTAYESRHLGTLRKQGHGMLAVLRRAFAGNSIQPARG